MRSGYRYNAFPKVFAKLPTMFGNLWQALRDRRHSLESLERFERSLEVFEKFLNTAKNNISINRLLADINLKVPHHTNHRLSLWTNSRFLEQSMTSSSSLRTGSQRGRKKKFGDRKRDSVSEASGSRSSERSQWDAALPRHQTALGSSRSP